MFKLERILSNEAWNDYRQLVLDTPYTSFTLLPDWLEGYCIIPFYIKKIGFLIYNNNKDIIGGIAGIRFWFGKWVTIYPSDPILLQEFQNMEINKSEVLLKLFQITKGKIHISTSTENSASLGLIKGKFPKGFYPDPGLGLIRIENDKDLITALKPKVRRDIRLSQRRGVIVKAVKDSKSLKDIYALFAMNARNNGYKIRPFYLFHKMWLKMHNNETALFLVATVDNQIKGSMWLINSGRSLHYIMGATFKEEVELNVGYALQFSALNESKKLGFDTYNISIGGPKNVEKFKDDFGRKKELIKDSYVGFF